MSPRVLRVLVCQERFRSLGYARSDPCVSRTRGSLARVPTNQHAYGCTDLPISLLHILFIHISGSRGLTHDILQGRRRNEFRSGGPGLGRGRLVQRHRSLRKGRGGGEERSGGGCRENNRESQRFDDHGYVMIGMLRMEDWLRNGWSNNCGESSDTERSWALSESEQVQNHTDRPRKFFGLRSDGGDAAAVTVDEVWVSRRVVDVSIRVSILCRTGYPS